MAGKPNVAGMVSDPDFLGLSPADQRNALTRLTGDSAFSQLSDGDTLSFVSKMGGGMNLRPSLSSMPGAARPQSIQPVDITGNPQNPAAATAGLPGGSSSPAAATPGYSAAVGVPLGIAAAYMGGATALPFLRAIATKYPRATQFVTSAAASEAISQARRIPYVGKFVPPYAEMLPFLRGEKGAPKAEPEPTYPGALEPTATPEQLNPSLASGARTTPGQVGAERIFGPRPTPAQPIPPRQGLMLPGEVMPEPEPSYPGASYPERPSPELLKSRSLQEGPRPVTDPAAGLGDIPVRGTPAPIAAPPVSRSALSRQLDANLNNAVGNRPLQPGIPLRNQYRPQATPVTPDASGMTPVEGSSAVKAFRYDREAQELHVTSKDGTTYVSGEVTPDQAFNFAAAESKGQAWKAIRDNSPLVGKIPPGGKRIAVKPTIRSASPDYEYLNNPEKWNQQNKY